jgi:hypothetical protein
VGRITYDKQEAGKKMKTKVKLIINEKIVEINIGSVKSAFYLFRFFGIGWKMISWNRWIFSFRQFHSRCSHSGTFFGFAWARQMLVFFCVSKRPIGVCCVELIGVAVVTICKACSKVS